MYSFKGRTRHQYPTFSIRARQAPWPDQDFQSFPCAAGGLGFPSWQMISTFGERPRQIGRVLWVSVAMAAGAMAQGRGGAPAGPLRAEVFEVKAVERERRLSAIGTLRANESAEIVAELAKRVVAIPVEEGARVEAGEVLFQLDDAELKAALDETAARLRLAEANAERAAQLLPDQAISRQEFEAAKAEVDVLRAQVAAQEVELSKSLIRAPFAGRIGVRRVSPGALVTPGLVLAVLQDGSRIKVDFTLPERHAAEVAVGQAIHFTVAGSGVVHEGRVAVIEPEIDAATRSVRVRGICESPDGLFPGGVAEVELTLDGRTSGFPIPAQAILPSASGQAVMVIENGRARLQPVVTGNRTPSEVEILRGLSEGDRIATTNLLRIRPGVDVIAEGAAEP